ncbi:chemotaxis protein, partial [Elstera litoralis]
QGQFISDEFKRIGKGGREVWIQATYNPVFDPQGRPVKVVKYAIDVTETVNQRLRTEVVGQQIDTNLAQIVQSISGINHQTGLVASAATQTSSSFQTVAASAEELAASIGEVANSVVRSKTSVDGAMDYISVADDEAHRLIVAAEAMSSVTKFIQDIASSINLLALNATIESARAGEAGRGFAVVAGEVKTLAQQVAQATESIAREITGIQSISSGVSTALNKISGAMADVQNLVSGVAGAIEQQTAVTLDISSNMNNTAGAVTNIEESMHSILQSVDSARGLSNESLRLYAQLQKAS